MNPNANIGLVVKMPNGSAMVKNAIEGIRRGIAPSLRRSLELRRQSFCVAAVLLGAVIAPACSDNVGPEAADLERNRAKWAALGIQSYAYDFQRTCFCPPETTRPVRIRVENGEVTGVVFRESGEPVDSADVELYPTIDGLFEQLEAAIEGEADSIRASYDPRLGHPTEAFIDFDLQTIDEEQGFTAGNLDPFELEPLTEGDLKPGPRRHRERMIGRIVPRPFRDA